MAMSYVRIIVYNIPCQAIRSS